MPLRQCQNWATLKDALPELVEEVRCQYHRLIIVCASTGIGDGHLSAIADGYAWPLININLLLSRELKDFGATIRGVKADQVFRSAITTCQSDVTCLDHTEILFDRSINQNPLLMLRHISRNKTIIAAWNGAATERHLIFADARHPEYRRTDIDDEFVLVLPDAHEGYSVAPEEARP